MQKQENPRTSAVPIFLITSSKWGELLLAPDLRQCKSFNFGNQENNKQISSFSSDKCKV